jgi:tetratricopeptide (TPR) repeat protein
MRREWIIYLALLVITAAVYWPVSGYDYINLDDAAYAAENPHVQQGLTLAGVSWAFQPVKRVANWHPVTWLSLMLDCQLFGNSPGAHHMVNLLFHLANVLLLFHVWRRMTNDLWPSALVAALFAWHPLHIESVAWISERKDVLSTFFGLLTIWAYAQFAEQSKVRSPRSKVFYGLALLWFALGLMSKPMLVTWPFVLLLLDFWPLGRVTSDNWRVTKLRIPVPQLSSLNHLLLEKLPFFILAIASSAVTFYVQRTSGVMSLVSYLPIWERCSNAVVCCVLYLGKMIWPWQLAFFYPYHSWAAWQVVGSAVLLALISLLTVWQLRRRPFLIVGWLWFLGTLVPVTGFVQVGMQSMADRYSYIPLIGPFVMMVWGGKEIGGARAYAQFIRGAVMAAALAICLAATSLQLGYWRNGEILCRRALEVTENNVLVHYLLGKTLMDEGRVNEGMPQLNAALQPTPWFSMEITGWFYEIQYELGTGYAQQGMTQEAIDHYQEAIRRNSARPEALNGLAWLLATGPDAKFRDGAEAVRLAQEACDMTHYHETVYVGTLAAAYAEAGQYNDAIQTAETAIDLARAAGETNLLAANLRLLEVYRAGHPYHEKSKL